MCLYGASPSLVGALMFASDEMNLWCLSGARSISHLIALASEGG
jgi:hypothetical protein